MRLADCGRRLAPAVLVIAALAGLAAILEPNAYPSYDYAFAIASAQDVLAGRATGYEVPIFSPVPHPLTMVEALLVVPLGDAAFPVFSAVALLAFGLLCWAVFRIGTALAAWPVGVLAAGAVFTSPPIFELAVRTYGDVMFAALMMSAVALEVARPRRGLPVLVVLAIAGLVRPEAWGFSALYWLYVARGTAWRGRMRLAAVALSAPALWMVMDLLLTGDPLHSVEVTREYTQKADASVSLDDLWVALRALAGWPVMLGAVAGALVAWRRTRDPALPVLAVGVGALLATVAPALLGESPVLRRYLIVPGAVLALFFAIACLGWAGPGRRSRTWQAAGTALLVVAAIVLAGDRADLWDAHRRDQDERVELLEHLRKWATSSPARAYLTLPACRPVLVPGYGYRPYLRYWLDVPPRAVAFHFGDASPPEGAVLLPTAADSHQRRMLTVVGQRTRATVLGAAEFGERFRRVAGTSRWDLYAGPGCRRAASGAPASRDT